MTLTERILSQADLFERCTGHKPRLALINPADGVAAPRAVGEIEVLELTTVPRGIVWMRRS